jgi:hypothetical protein
MAMQNAKGAHIEQKTALLLNRRKKPEFGWRVGAFPEFFQGN